MADEKKDGGRNKLSPPTVKVDQKKQGSVFGWARNTYFYFFTALAFGLVISKSYSTYEEVGKIWEGDKKQETVVRNESGANHSSVSQLSCNNCETCVEQAIGQTKTRVSPAETFPGYRGTVRICHQGNTFEAFIKKDGKEVKQTFGPENEFPFTSEDWKEFYLVGDTGSAVSVCKCNN